jgi:colicin import membrane protein
MALKSVQQLQAGKIAAEARMAVPVGRAMRSVQRAFAPLPAASSSAAAKPPASKADRFEGLRLMQGYLGPKRSPEELAAAKAKAAEAKRQKEAEDARKAGEKAKKAREKAELEAKERAEKEQRKTQLKQLRAERLADDKARLKARKG